MRVNNGRTTISEAERARRRQAVDDARHSTEMEGGRSSDAIREAQEAYVRGEIEIDQMLELARRS